MLGQGWDVHVIDLKHQVKKLIKTFYPHVKNWKEELPADEALVNTSRAKTLIGFEAEYPLI
jgi:hypothetical protein